MSKKFLKSLESKLLIHQSKSVKLNALSSFTLRPYYPINQVFIELQ